LKDFWNLFVFLSSDDSSSTKDEAFARFLNHRAENPTKVARPLNGKLKIQVISTQPKPRVEEPTEEVHREEEPSNEQSQSLTVRKLLTIDEVQEFDDRLGRDARFREHVVSFMVH
jgi:hypothetical protein